MGHTMQRYIFIFLGLILVGACDASRAATDAGPMVDGTNEPDSNGLCGSDNCEIQPVGHPLATNSSSVNGSGFLYTKNVKAKGLVLMFHGKGGAKETVFEERVESVLIAQAALLRGYAVVALDSVSHLGSDDSDEYKWNETKTIENPDIQNVIQMIAMLRGELGAVPHDAPIFVIGFSNGGTMASHVCQHVEIAAAAIFISNAKAFHSPLAKVPPLILMPSENDPGFAAESATNIKSLHPHVVVNITPARPITPGIFSRIPGIGCEASTSIGNALQAAGIADAKGNVLSDPVANLSWIDAIPDAYRAKATLRQLRDVILERYAGHSPSSESAVSVFDLFDSY